MGLSMVHGIVWNYGGWIDVQSTPGKGSIFHVYLPVAEPDPCENHKPDKVELQIGSGEKILFVDDEIQICNSEAYILESSGYDVYTVTDPRKAEKIFRETPGGFDIVITDLNMPHINGIDLAEKLIKLRPGTPVILTTGYRHYSRLVDSEKIEKTGIAAFLKKPYDKDQLVQTVINCLRRVRDNNYQPT